MSTTVYTSRIAQDAVAAQPVKASAGLRIDGAKGLAAMLLTAVIAALVVLGDQLISTWADEHLLVAWIALWVVAFSVMALLAPSVSKLSRSLMASWAERREQARRARADDKLWALAQGDNRVMADLQAAISRAQD